MKLKVLKYIAGFFLTFLISQNVLSDNLCSTTCQLAITFPAGGTIEAVEPVTIVFDDGGFINDGITTTGYAAGETMSLSVGESIVFLSNGMLDLGINGNIDYSNMIITGGSVNVTAVGEGASILIHQLTLIGSLEHYLLGDALVVEAGQLTLSGDDITVYFDNLTVEGKLNLEQVNNVFLIGSGSIIFDNGVKAVPSDDCKLVSNVTLSSGRSIGYMSANSVTVTLNTITPPDIIEPCLVSTGGIISLSGNSGTTIVPNTSVPINEGTISVTGNGGLTLAPDTSAPNINGTLTIFDGGEISIVPVTTTGSIGTGIIDVEALTQDLLVEMPDGTQLSTNDGDTCTLDSGECVSSSGARYIVVDGQLMVDASATTGSADGSSGAMSWYLFLLLSGLLWCRKNLYDCHK